MADPALRELDDTTLLDRIGKMVAGADALVEAYRASRPGATAADLFQALLTDRVFRMPAISMAGAHLAHSPETFVYLFTWASPVMGGLLGSCHALEIPFVFGTHTSGMTSMFTGAGPQADALAEAMQDAWLSFARTGQPAAPSLPAWPAYDTTERPTMVLGASFAVEADPGAADRQAWDGRL
jgi:para-nitrobenzyl esterase